MAGTADRGAAVTAPPVPEPVSPAIGHTPAMSSRRASHATVIFDDGRGHLGPLADLRASFEIRTGVHRLGERIAATRPKSLAAYHVPERLAALVAERADAPVNRLPDDEVLYLANGRWARPDADHPLEPGEAWIEGPTGDVIAALLRRADAEYLLQSGELPERVRSIESADRRLVRHPWDVLTGLAETIEHDVLGLRLPDALVPREVGDVTGDHPIELHASATVGPQVVFDASKGPVFVDAGATIRPGAILCGPVAILRGSTVLDRALVKAATAIGPMCKVAGEVGGTVFQGCSNKGHDGHLGDAWVGEWVNLGAGTTNSNLLNTYGEVSVRTEPEGPRRRTGRAFVGCFLGDHVKTAIGTRIMTGTVVGTGAMIATSTPPPSTVRRFAWLTDDGASSYRWPRFETAARAMMDRRDVTPSDAMLDALRTLHARHVEEREPAAS